MKRAAALLLAFAWVTANAEACAVCFGAKGDPVNEAIGSSILFMIGVISVVLCSIVGLFAAFFIRAARHPLNDGAVGDTL